MARSRSRRSSERSRRFPCRCRRAARAQPWPCAPRCSAWPPGGRRRRSRSCPGRRRASPASRTAAPCARARRTPRSRRGGGTCRWCRPPPGPTSCRAGSSRCPALASHGARAGGPASGRLGHPGAPCPRSRSWRNRGRTASSPPRCRRERLPSRNHSSMRIRSRVVGDFPERARDASGKREFYHETPHLLLDFSVHRPWLRVRALMIGQGEYRLGNNELVQVAAARRTGGDRPAGRIGAA